MRTTLLVFIGALGLVSTAAAQTPRARAVAAPTGTSFIGVMVQEIDSERAKALKLREEAGVEVTRVEADSPAEKGGLKAGDVVMHYNGQRVEGMEQFSRMVRETPPGREAKLEIVRNGAPQTLTVKAGVRRPGFSAMPPMAPMAPLPPMERFDIHMPDIPRSFMSWRSSALGIEAESLEGQLAQYFGVKEGVLVRAVTKGSAAEKAGMRAGDVIVRIEDGKVASPADISGRIRSLRGKTVPILLMRDRKETTLNVAFDDEDRAEWFYQQNVRPHGRPHVVQE